MSENSQIKCVIFDLDGTLTDKQLLNDRSYSKALLEQGVEIDIEEIKLKHRGKTGIKMLRDIEIERNTKIDIDSILPRKTQLFNEFSSEITIFPLMETLLKLFSAHYITALMTVSRKESVNIVLNVLGINDMFDLIFTAEDMNGGKDSPEVFVAIAKKLKLGPRECLIIDDSKMALKNASLAGMQVLEARNGTMKTFQ